LRFTGQVGNSNGTNLSLDTNLRNVRDFRHGYLLWCSLRTCVRGSTYAEYPPELVADQEAELAPASGSEPTWANNKSSNRKPDIRASRQR
jgi:hypothetical protein